PRASFRSPRKTQRRGLRPIFASLRKQEIIAAVGHFGQTTPRVGCDLLEKTLMIAGLRLVKSKSSQPNQEIQNAPDPSSFEALIAFELGARSAGSGGGHGRVCS